MATAILQKIDSYYKQFDKDEITASQLRDLVEEDFDKVKKDSNPEPEPKTRGNVAFFGTTPRYCSECTAYQEYCWHPKKDDENNFSKMIKRASAASNAQSALNRYNPEFLKSHADILERGLLRHPNDLILIIMVQQKKVLLKSLKGWEEEKAVVDARYEFEEANRSAERYEKQLSNANVRLQEATTEVQSLEKWVVAAKTDVITAKRKLEKVEKNVLQ